MRIKRAMYLIPVFLIVFIASFSLSADATPIGSRADLSSGLTTLDFEGLVPGDAPITVTDQYLAQGIEFEGAEINFFTGQRLVSTDTAYPAVITGIFTGIDVNVIGLDFLSTVPLTLIAYDADWNEIERTDSGTQTSGFLGLHTDTSIAFFKLHDHGRHFVTDNVSFGFVPAATSSGIPAVPEPGTLVLLGSGLVGIGIIGRKIKL